MSVFVFTVISFCIDKSIEFTDEIVKYIHTIEIKISEKELENS